MCSFFSLAACALNKRISLRSIQKAITLWGLIINYQFNSKTRKGEQKNEM